ncbi:MAG: peptidoglycan DD-metalloendopeptidase family protein [Pseudomonadota bacterium]
MRFFVFLLLIAFSGIAYAQAPIPSENPINQIEQSKEERKRKEAELKKEMAQIKSDLKSKKNDLLKVAKNIKANESKLLNLQGEIDKKLQEQLSIEVNLEKDRAALSNLVLAMQRIERVPPEALIVRPGAPLETAQSAMLLQNILPRLYKKADELNTSLEKLNQVVADLESSRKKALDTAKNLQISQGRLNALLNERELLYSKTEKDAVQNKQELARISKEAKNLRDLVKRIERKQQKEEEQRRQAKKSNIKKAVIKTPVPSAGEAQLPISGIIKTSYGKSDDIGALSKGLKIEGRKNALVVSPMGGVIDYAGPFKGYGNIVIIRHQKDYHSLVAGLSKIDTVVGRAVSAGEPIGKMGNSSEEISLYYELRHKGQPVNPSKKISGL